MAIYHVYMVFRWVVFGSPYFSFPPPEKTTLRRGFLAAGVRRGGPVPGAGGRSVMWGSRLGRTGAAVESFGSGGGGSRIDAVLGSIRGRDEVVYGSG